MLDINSIFLAISLLPIISGDETRETRKKVYEYDIVDMLDKDNYVSMVTYFFDESSVIDLIFSKLNLLINGVDDNFMLGDILSREL